MNDFDADETLDVGEMIDGLLGNEVYVADDELGFEAPVV